MPAEEPLLESAGIAADAPPARKLLGIVHLEDDLILVVFHRGELPHERGWDPLVGLNEHLLRTFPSTIVS